MRIRIDEARFGPESADGHYANTFSFYLAGLQGDPGDPIEHSP
jgi:hypothetical protein